MPPKHPFTSPSGHSYTKEEIAAYFLQSVQTVKAELPDLLANRLTHGRHARNHGSFNDFYLINLWDKRQTDVIPKDHFNYCLNYCRNRRNGISEDGEVHLWLNKIRLYQNRGDIIKLLDKRLPRAIPDGFNFQSTERFYTVSHRFYFPADMELLVGYVVPLYKQLIHNIHPILMEVIDELTGPMEKEALRQVIRERDRIPFKHPGRQTEEELRAYSRSIAPSLRQKILKKYHHKCAQCGRDLHKSGAHIDHIVPFSKGGLTTADNLQALWPQCNLTKGNR